MSYHFVCGNDNNDTNVSKFYYLPTYQVEGVISFQQPPEAGILAYLHFTGRKLSLPEVRNKSQVTQIVLA